MNPLHFAGKADAYLEWAAHTGFDHFHAPADEIGLVWEHSDSITSTTLPIRQLATDIAATTTGRVELATPVTGNLKATNVVIETHATEQAQAQALILGVIDDGCPFARPGLLARHRTRVQLLWDQNPVNPVANGVRYGRVLQSADLNKALKHGELRAYEHLGMQNLRRRATHGAHVLDVLAGPVPVRSRVSPSRFTLQDADGTAHLAPSWARPADAAGQAPIFFVQLPHEAIEDPTGRWLARHALDGLDFIIDNAKQLWGQSSKGKRLVVNLSWGPQTGPHDGSSLLERAFDQRIQACAIEGITLHITLPAGNSYEARAHGQFGASEGCSNLLWQAMPDAHSPQFLEIWWPTGTPLADVGLSVQSPTGAWLRLRGAALTTDPRGAILSAGAGHPWGITVVPHGSRYMALLALAPTRPREPSAAPAATPPHGRWRIDVGAVPGAPAERLVHVYVARNTANMGGRWRGPDGYLVDPAYEASRHGRWPRAEPASSRVRREGSLSGLATGGATTVAGGYVLTRDPKRTPLNPSESEPAAPYSSSGPAAHTERNPDWALPADESPCLRGVLAGGVREGSAVRLTGTSAAAPQLARKLANGETIDSPDGTPPPSERPEPPSATSNPRGRRVGKGRLIADIPRPTT